MNLQIQIETGTSPGYSCTEGLVVYLRIFSVLSPDSMKKGRGQCYWATWLKGTTKGLVSLGFHYSGSGTVQWPTYSSVTLYHTYEDGLKGECFYKVLFSAICQANEVGIILSCAVDSCSLYWPFLKMVQFFIWTQMWNFIHKYCRCLSLPKWIIFYEGDYSHMGNEYASDTCRDWKLTY